MEPGSTDQLLARFGGLGRLRVLGWEMQGLGCLVFEAGGPGRGTGARRQVCVLTRRMLALKLDSLQQGLVMCRLCSENCRI